jgi:hypothetical protein
MDGNGLDASANEMGVHRFKGGAASLVPPPDAPNLEAEFKVIWSELNPRFVPLWIRNEYQTPNDGRVRTLSLGVGALMTGTCNVRPFKGLMLPTGRVYGRRFRGPIVLYDILDGLTHEERQEAKLPRWDPITTPSLEFARFKAWVDRHQARLQQLNDEDRRESETAARVKREIQQNIAYRKRHLDYDGAHAWGQASRIFIPSTFAA